MIGGKWKRLVCLSVIESALLARWREREEGLQQTWDIAIGCVCLGEIEQERDAYSLPESSVA